MEKLLKKLQELKEMAKKATPSLPTLSSPKPPKVGAPDPAPAPEAPKAGAASSKKDPTKVAEQLKDPGFKNEAMKNAKKIKEGVTVSAKGQWSLKS